MLSTALTQNTWSNAEMRVTNETKSVCKRSWSNCKVLSPYITKGTEKKTQNHQPKVDSWSQYLPVFKQSTFRIKSQALFSESFILLGFVHRPVFNMNVTTFREADQSPSQPRPQKQHLISCVPEDKVFWTTGLGSAKKENSLPFCLKTGTYDWQSTDVWVVLHSKSSLSNLYLFLHILIFGALCIILELLFNEIASTLSNFCSYMRPFFITSFQRNARQNCIHTFVSPNNFSFLTWTRDVWPCKMDQINTDPKGNWHWLARKKND
jgi:hypothetical protein